MKNKQTERKLRPSIGLTRHLVGGVLCLAAISLICARASAQNLFVSVRDVVGGKIFVFTPDGVQSTFASGLSNPAGLAFDSAGNLFVGDGDAIYKFTPEGVRSTFALGLSSPYPIGCDSAGNLFVADGSGSILKFTPNGARTTFASGVSGFEAVDGAGNLFVANTVYNAPPGKPATATSFIIYKFTPNGMRSTFAKGSFPTAFGSVASLGVDHSGNLYLVDAGQFYDGGASAIYKFTPAGNRSTFFGPTEMWTQCFLGSLAVDSLGNVFVTDDCRGIDKITQDGNQTFFASPIGYAGPLAVQPAQTAPTPRLINISARGSVEAGDNALIAGFMFTPSDPEQFIIRGLGPTLGNFGVSDALQNPVLALHNSTSTMMLNDDWQTAANASQIPMNYRPPDIRESALMATLPPGAYTAVLSGKNATTGNGLLEVYSPLSGLSNASIRGFVGTGDHILIGGFSSSGANGSIQLIIRALGPTLTQFGVNGALADPTLTLVDGNGNVHASNDNWKNTQQSTIQATGFAPPNDHESAILATLPNGNYTAIVLGKNGTTGVALLEVYKVALTTNK